MGEVFIFKKLETGGTIQGQQSIKPWIQSPTAKEREVRCKLVGWAK